MVEKLQIVFYILVIFSSIITLATLLINYLRNKQKARHERTLYTPQQKREYYEKRANNPKLTVSQRNYALKQLKSLDS